MKKNGVDVYRQQLLSLRARCNGDVSALAEEALKKNAQDSTNLSSMPIHMADIGTDAFDHEFTLSLLENEQEVLGEIDAALQRIDAGAFGKCEECQGKIPVDRLRAIPYTRYCVACARKLEERS